MADAQREKSLEQMISAMSQTGVDEASTGYTLGWDVVVSYSEKEINEHLKQKWEKSKKDDTRKMLTKIELLSSSFDDETGVTKWSYRTLSLGPPRVEFEGAAVMEPAVHLVLPVEAVYWQAANSKKEKIGTSSVQLKGASNPYDIRLSGISLGSVKGKYDSIMQPRKDGEVVSRDTLPDPIDPSKKTCQFREDNTKPTKKDFQNAWVVLDFPLDGKNLNINLTNNVKQDHPKWEDAENLSDSIFVAVKKYFQGGPPRIDILEYALATMKNTPEYDGAVTNDLTPVSFRFATYSSSYQSSILSLFIHTMSGKDAGEKSDLQVKWLAQWTKKRISPIPAGYTASLIFNPLLLYDVMLKPGTEKVGKYKLGSIKDNKDGGISFTAWPSKGWSVSGVDLHYPGGTLKFGRECSLEISGFTKDLDKDPLSIKFYQQSSSRSPVAKLDWKFTVENTWTDVTRYSPRILYMEKEMRTTFTLDAVVDMDIKVTDSNFSFKLIMQTLEDSWKSSTYERDGGIGTLLNNLVSPGPAAMAENEKIKWMKSLEPTIELGEVGLGFFLTTNLLNPGSKVIKLEQNLLRIPRDLVLVGDVVQLVS